MGCTLSILLAARTARCTVQGSPPPAPPGTVRTEVPFGLRNSFCKSQTSTLLHDLHGESCPARGDEMARRSTPRANPTRDGARERSLEALGLAGSRGLARQRR